jgi:hypothetical protein
VKELRSLGTILMVTERVIPLTKQLAENIQKRKKLHGLLPRPFHHHSIDIFVWLNL